MIKLELIKLLFPILNSHILDKIEILNRIEYGKNFLEYKNIYKKGDSNIKNVVKINLGIFFFYKFYYTIDENFITLITIFEYRILFMKVIFYFL